MYQDLYEDMVRFASEGYLNEELRLAKVDYIQRTGELFESDTAFEKRLASFLEWYVLDRTLHSAINLTPAQLYIRHLADTNTQPAAVHDGYGLLVSIASLFQYKKVKDNHLHVVDLLTNQTYQVFERRKPAGLHINAILEARLIPVKGKLLFSETFSVLPYKVQSIVLRACKNFRKQTQYKQIFTDKINFIHRVAFLTNRCARYKHIDPQQIFNELLTPGV